MDALLTKRTPTFQGLGPSLLNARTRGELQRHSIPETLQSARELLHDHCPLTPGVYGWLDSRQQICYIGKSKCLKKRLLTYFAKQPSDKKAFRIRQHGHSLVWEATTNELLSLIREQELINRWRPEFNTQGQPTKRQPGFLCFSKGPAPNAYFARKVTNKAQLSLGPVAGTGRLRAAIECLNHVFQLRDCPDRTRFEFSNQQQLFANPMTAGCIRFELGSCPAPCAAQCSSADYLANVKRATTFVSGGDKTTIGELQRLMSVAAGNQCFEKATVLRDQIHHLRWLDRRMAALRQATQKYHGVFPVPTLTDQTAWLVLCRGRLVGSLLSPQDDLTAVEGIKTLTPFAARKKSLPDSILDMHLQWIIISWFRRHPKLKKNIIPFRNAIQLCEAQMDKRLTA
ncbi:MAG: GIY-YIG nuclease family protein [Planctomycetota bacterium]